MKADYDECERRVLLSEGGYTNDPRDPGGPTNWGITLADARAYWKRGATAEDVRNMPRGVACEIYKLKYWDELNGDQLPSGVDYSVFDYGINSGVSRSGRVLRSILALPTKDWHVTPEVLDKLKTVHAATVIEAINNERMSFLRGLRTFPHFGKGWTARVSSVRAYSEHIAHDLTGDPPAPHVTPADDVMAKAFSPADIVCAPLIHFV